METIAEVIIKLFKNRKMKLKIVLLLYWLPICLITNRWYKWMYGDYTVKFDMQYCIDNFNMKSILCFAFFVLLSVGSYFIEKQILPFMFLFTKKIQTRKATINTNVIVKKIKKMSLGNIYRSINISQLNEFHIDIMFIPCVISLWIIYINIIWLYSLILILLYITYLVVSISETQFYEHNRK